MFHSESKFQQLIHEQPEIVLSGIPEINTQYCPDVPSIVSLGREIPLSSGPIDNLYIDANAIITFVECKRYSDSRIKREVYAQAINYASDLSSMLMHYTVEQFLSEFFRIIQNAEGCPFISLDDCPLTGEDDPAYTVAPQSASGTFRDIHA